MEDSPRLHPCLRLIIPQETWMRRIKLGIAAMTQEQ